MELSQLLEAVETITAEQHREIFDTNNNNNNQN